jgi:hypothetical protein
MKDTKMGLGKMAKKAAMDDGRGEVMSRSYMKQASDVGKYVGQEALFKGQKDKKSRKQSAMGPNPEGHGGGYSGMTSVY